MYANRHTHLCGNRNKEESKHPFRESNESLHSVQAVLLVSGDSDTLTLFWSWVGTLERPPQLCHQGATFTKTRNNIMRGLAGGPEAEVLCLGPPVLTCLMAPGCSQDATGPCCWPPHCCGAQCWGEDNHLPSSVSCLVHPKKALGMKAERCSMLLLIGPNPAPSWPTSWFQHLPAMMSCFCCSHSSGSGHTLRCIIKVMI